MYCILEEGLLADEIEIISRGSFRSYLQPGLEEELLSGQISLPEMRETRNVSWHPGRISTEKAVSSIADSDGI